ncbi:ROK family protein [Chloroflexia bacterium SDU3-3]|nr:ROK family protein [Chloroflexia bacterium SDU3-3]
MDVLVGLDIGGTKLLVAAADRSGAILRRAQRPTPLALDAGLAALHELIAEVCGDDQIVAIGAAAGGPLDYERGVVSPLHQPKWRDVPLKQLFERAYGCPFAVDVDANVAALGEYRWGGEPVDRLLYLTLSTGMGGGLVVDGQIYRGARGEHPEVGHQAIPFRCAHPERVRCECGLDDCLEALISGNAIRRIYERPAEQLAPDEWAEVAYNLGQGLRNMATFYAPDVIALGGGVAVGGGAVLVDAAARHMADHLRLVQPPNVRLSTLGYDTALYGTIALALDAERTAAL